MKRSSIILLVTILITIYQIFFLTGCKAEEGFGYETNGILEGTVWGNGTATLSFSKNAVTVSAPIDFKFESLYNGTYYSYLSGSLVYVNNGGSKLIFDFEYDQLVCSNHTNSDAYFYPFSGKKKGFGYETNGILEGTVWEKGTTTLSFSKNAVTVSAPIDFGSMSLSKGTYYSYLRDSYVVVNSKNYGGSFFYFTLIGAGLSYYSSNLGEMSPFYPSFGTVLINGKTRYYNNFVAEETDGGLMITKYTGNLKNIIIPAEIGGVPVVAIGSGNKSPFYFDDGTGRDNFLQLASVIIPDSVKTIKPGVFRSRDLFGYGSSGTYLSGGITIGANVTIMGANAGVGWDQGWGALDTAKVGEGNFIAYEREHLGYWLDIGFTKFYNENGRKAGTYKWSSSYNSYDYNYTFTWSYAPAFIIER